VNRPLLTLDFRLKTLDSAVLTTMTAAEFKKKWSRYTGKESAAYQEHFNDLCRLLGQPSPPSRPSAPISSVSKNALSKTGILRTP